MHTALRLERRSSRRLTWLLLALHAAAAATLAWLAPPLVVTLPLLLVMGASLTYGIVAQAVPVWPGAVTRLQRHEDGRWTLTRRDGRFETVRLRPDSRIGQGWMVLRFAAGRRRTVSVVLAADAVAPSTLRRLMVLLRWLSEQRTTNMARRWRVGFDGGGRHVR